jgi:hemoglobin-like flavoprotein
MQLSQIQIRLVQRSFGRAATRKRQMATLFFDRLFELDPTLRPQFSSDLDEQGRRFMRSLALIVSLLDKPAELQQRLHAMSHAHDSRLFEPGPLDTASAALIWALEQTLGREFTPVVRDAWQSACAAVISRLPSHPAAC